MNTGVNSQAINSGKPRAGFRSAKISVPIIYPRRWHGSALIQLTLDSRVRKIVAPSEPGNLNFSVIIEFFGGEEKSTFFVETAEEAAAMNLYRPTAMVVSRSEVYAEPRFSTCHEIWKSRHVRISLADRLRVLSALDAAPNGMTIADAAQLIRTRAADHFDCIARLICDGDLTVNLATKVDLSSSLRTTLQRSSAQSLRCESGA